MQTNIFEAPWDFIKAVENTFHVRFTHDMCGTEDNSKAPTVFTKELDSLALDYWPDGPRDVCWVNPPFKDVGDWVGKCFEQSDPAKRYRCRIVLIIPLSGDLNTIPAWKYSDVVIVHGRVWPEVRGCMLCFWGFDTRQSSRVHGYRWDRKNRTLKQEW